MSMVSTHLRQRVIESYAPREHASDAASARTTLAELGCGRRARIVDVGGDADPATARRMFDLGFAPGVEVEVLRRAPLADPVIFRIAGYEIALRRVQARCIEVSTPA